MSLPTVLIIDDEPDFCSDLSLVLSRDFLVSASHDGKEALELVDELSPDLVLLDVEFRPGQMPGLEILEHLQAKEDPPPVIMLSGSRDINVVVQAVKLGAFHYVNKGADLPDLVNLMGMAMSSRRDRLTIMAQRAEVQRLTGNLIARDPATIKILDKVDQVAATDVNVLITGESGTGKEMIARRLHNESGVSGTLVGINCATFEGDLINSEIFGHVKGAFTGADRDHMGKIELATGGTLFLDEIGESDPKFQSRLLRALSEKTYTRVGCHKERQVRTRIVAATSKKLSDAMQREEFREDLYYRLNQFRIHVPPLRERTGDILPLARAFLMESAARFGKGSLQFSEGVERRLVQQPWPGNVRELRYEIERAVLSSTGDIISLGDMFQLDEPDPTTRLPYEEAKEKVVGDWQRGYATELLRETEGNVTKAAEMAGMPRQSFQRLLRKLKLNPEEFRD
jgi:DNA-binding NtrC family response regulator